MKKTSKAHRSVFYVLSGHAWKHAVHLILNGGQLFLADFSAHENGFVTIKVFFERCPHAHLTRHIRLDFDLLWSSKSCEKGAPFRIVTGRFLSRKT